MEAIALLLIGTLGPVITAVGVYITGKRLGLGGVAIDLREQRGALVATLKTRVDTLEHENADLRRDLEEERQRVSKLEREKESMASRIDALEEALGDLAAEGKVHVRTRDNG